MAWRGKGGEGLDLEGAGNWRGKGADERRAKELRRGDFGGREMGLGDIRVGGIKLEKLRGDGGMRWELWVSRAGSGGVGQGIEGEILVGWSPFGGITALLGWSHVVSSSPPVGAGSARPLPFPRAGRRAAGAEPRPSPGARPRPSRIFTLPPKIQAWFPQNLTPP